MERETNIDVGVFTGAEGGIDTNTSPDAVHDSADVLPFKPRTEFGNSQSEWVCVADLNRLEQTRQHYDPESIAELADSMVTYDHNGVAQFELIHDLMVGVFDDETLESYLQDHEDFYDTTVDRESLKRGADGNWHLVIAGHRRSLGVEMNCTKANVAFEDAFIRSSVKRDISFEEALVLQLRENVHLRPPAIDEARQIDRYFRLRSRREKTRPSIASCARVLGFSETKVSEALRFAQLPVEVQREANKGMISYGHAVELFSYADVLRTYYSRKYLATYSDPDSTRTLDGDVAMGTLALVKKLKSEELRGANARKKSDIIKANVNNIVEAMSYHDGELFTMEEDASPELKLRKANARLAQTALNVMIQVFDTNDELSARDEKMLNQLRELLAAHEHRRAAPPEEDTALLGLDVTA